MDRELTIIGAALGIGGRDKGSSEGPDVILHSTYLNLLKQAGITATWQTTLREKQTTKDPLTVIHDFCEALGSVTRTLTELKRPFCVIGGDHSMAIGTWSGAATALKSQGPIGLIWIDAHDDAHTHDTSITGNIHGMPVAALLGRGNKALTDILEQYPKLQPEHICLVGIRSFEPAEAALLASLGVKIFDMDAIHALGLKEVMRQAKAHITTNTIGYGVSFDIDAIDPSEAPAVGTPAPGGINCDELLKTLLHYHKDPNFIGFEIAEFNPHLDLDKKTERLIVKFIAALAGGKLL